MEDLNKKVALEILARTFVKSAEEEKKGFEELSWIGDSVVCADYY